MAAQNEGGQPGAVTQEVRLTTFPGEAISLFVVPIFPVGDPRNTNEPKGRPGKYRVTIVFARPGRFEVAEKAITFSDQLAGDSHIAVTRPALVSDPIPGAVGIRVRARSDAGAFVFNGKPNGNGYLGKLVSDPFDAQNFDEALKKGYHAIAPSLSNWSAQLDVPLYIAQTDATELQTGAVHVRAFTPPLDVGLAVEWETTLSPDFFYYTGIYREALNSNSPAYRFLCLYKIIEGIRARRNRLAKEARASGREPERFESEIVPAEPPALRPWLSALYGAREWPQDAVEQALPPAIRGKRFGQIIESTLMPLRNEIAHAILDTGELGMSADNMLKIERVILWLPLTRTIVRRMLKNSFRGQFMAHRSEPPRQTTGASNAETVDSELSR